MGWSVAVVFYECGHDMLMDNICVVEWGLRVFADEQVRLLVDRFELVTGVRRIGGTRGSFVGFWFFLGASSTRGMEDNIAPDICD